MGMYDDDNSRRPQGPSIGGRLIIALAIAVVGFLMYLSHSEENPVTGKRQHVAISPSQEIRLGLQSAPAMARQMGGELPATDSRVIEVKRVGQVIVENTAAKKSPWKFQFHVLADPKTVNAFALPGGQIFITEGLLNKLKTEAQLIGVLSHEMGHVIERHTAQQMAKSQLGNILVTAVATGASSPNDPSGYNANIVAGVVNHMFQLRYGRKDEAEADIWGIKLMMQLGYDPQAMIQVLEILKAQGGGGGHSEIFQTHPDPDHRIQLIRDYLKEHPADSNMRQGKNLQEPRRGILRSAD